MKTNAIALPTHLEQLSPAPANDLIVAVPPAPGGPAVRGRQVLRASWLPAPAPERGLRQRFFLVTEPAQD